MTNVFSAMTDMKTQNTVNQRLQLVIDKYESGNKSAFARRVDMKSGVIGDIVGGRLNKPSFDNLLKILSAYPSVNTEWLVKGEGEMLKTDNDTLARELRIGIDASRAGMETARDDEGKFVLTGRTTAEAFSAEVQAAALAKAYGLRSEQILAQASPSQPLSNILIDQLAGELLLKVPIEAQIEYVRNATAAAELDQLTDSSRADENTRRMFQIHDDSMAAALCETDWIIGRFVPDLRGIQSGEVYTLVATDGLYTRRITNAMDRRGALILLPNNPAHQADVLMAEDVLEAWAFEAKLTHRI